jgi:cytochrome c
MLRIIEIARPLLLLVAACLPGAVGAAEFMSPQLTYRLHCGGCHKQDGSGQNGFIPAFDRIGSFASLPAGREYLIRVPGVSQSELDNDALARLMNWLVETYGAAAQHGLFQPYTSAEVEVLRRQPASDASRRRRQLVAMLDGDVSASPSWVTADEPAAVASSEPPPGFALCAACHTTSASGAHGMGPNLRGVFGRRAGGAEGFGYSKSMRQSGVHWDAGRLDEFLRSPRSVISNTTMVYAGEPDAIKRAEIIEYLKNLR